MHVDLNYYFKIVSGHIHIKTSTSGDVGTLRRAKLDYWNPFFLYNLFNIPGSPRGSRKQVNMPIKS